MKKLGLLTIIACSILISNSLQANPTPPPPNLSYWGKQSWTALEDAGFNPAETTELLFEINNNFRIHDAVVILLGSRAIHKQAARKMLEFALEVGDYQKKNALEYVALKKLDPFKYRNDISSISTWQDENAFKSQVDSSPTPIKPDANPGPKPSTTLEKKQTFIKQGLGTPELIPQKPWQAKQQDWGNPKSLAGVILTMGDTLESKAGFKYEVVQFLKNVEGKARLYALKSQGTGSIVVLAIPANNTPADIAFVKTELKIDGFSLYEGPDFKGFSPYDSLKAEIMKAIGVPVHSPANQPFTETKFTTTAPPKGYATTYKSTRDKGKITSFAGREFADQDKFELPSGRKLRVIKYLDKGRRGRVYLVEDRKTKEQFALKIARDSQKGTLGSFARELKKTKGYADLQLPHAKIIEGGKDFFLKDFVEGQRGDEFMRDWANKHFVGEELKIKKLRGLILKIANSGTYIADLNRKNLIFSEKLGQWIIIDSGDLVAKQRSVDIIFTYMQSIHRNWGRDLLKIHSFMQARGCDLINGPFKDSLKGKKGLTDIQYPNGYPN